MYKVLLVDDEYMILNGLEKLIPWESLGFEVIGKAADGMSAFDFINHNNIDVVISDVSMPIMNGIDFIKRCRESEYHFEVIMLSGYQEFDFVRQAMMFDSISYLLKPVDTSEMVHALEKAKKKLDSKIDDIRKNSYLMEFLVQKWVHSEINKDELVDVFKLDDSYFGKKQYSVILFHCEVEKEKVIEIFEENQQLFYSFNTDESDWTLVFVGEREEKDSFIGQLCDELNLCENDISIGEIVNSFDDVFFSFTSALSSDKLKNFYYGKDRHDIFSNIAEKFSIPSISFEKFDAALGIHDMKLIRREQASIFNQMVKENVEPNYARNLTFLMLIELCRNFSISDQTYQKQIQKILVSSHFNDLYKCINETIDLIEKDSRHSYSDSTIQIIQIVNEEYQEELTLKSIAERLFINSLYAGQLFKKEVGKSFSQYLNDKRISVAKKYLLETNLSVGEIAINSGYSTSNYLSQSFKKYCGISPKDFRHQYEK
ncbi:response regulator [Enterococcus diestrammenae]|uniref:response regulator n=1 Tax=Enterococcus diestrammenae TaxID=1155073 RepID=UPI00195E7B91